MEQQDEQQTSKPETGLLSGLASLLRNSLALVFNRLELAGLEFGELRHNFFKLLLLCAVGVGTSLLALAYWSVLLVYLSWDSLGWKILLILACGFTLLSYVIFHRAQVMLANGKLSMPATMTELRNDRDALL
jgi:uncharacterized membrane protein YqjE